MNQVSEQLKEQPKLFSSGFSWIQKFSELSKTYAYFERVTW